MICRRVGFLAGLTLCVSCSVFAQSVTSAQSGFWSDPSTWVGNVVPNFPAAVVVEAGDTIVIDNSEAVAFSVEVRGVLTISGSSSLHVRARPGLPADFVVAGKVDVHGSLMGGDSVNYQTNASTLNFLSGSSFEHRGGPRAYIPIANWDLNSTLKITGFASTGYVALAYSDGWRQNFGRVTYECPRQSTFVDLNGHLRNIRGDLLIIHTNGNALRLSTTQRPVISVGGNLSVTGPSEVWFNTTGDSTTVLIGGDFIYASTSSGPGYCATRGRTFFRIQGNMEMNGSGPLRFCSGSADSTGVRRVTLELHNGLDMLRGNFICPAPGRSRIVFAGELPQHVSSASTSFSGNFDFHVASDALVDFGNGSVGGTGTLHVRGHVRLGSTAPGGALDPVAGNIRVSGTRRYYAGAVIEYNGVTPQQVGIFHPQNSNVDLILTNENVQLNQPLVVRDLKINATSLASKASWIDVSGNASWAGGSWTTSGLNLRFSGGMSSSISLPGIEIDTVIIAKSTGARLSIDAPLALRRHLRILNGGVILESRGNLSLLSQSDEPGGTASVGAIPAGSAVEGDVSVSRHMEGEGRIYRYLSSPVSGATVADMQDDFPVTGTFNDPSTGPGLKSGSPSLFYFDDNAPDGGSGWKAYPASGYASDAVLVPGRGYAAFIRRAVEATTWDVTGTLNQGEIVLPVQFTQGASDVNRGWNLVGNPFASDIQWLKAGGWTRSTDISDVVAVRDNGEGRFLYFDGDIGDLSSGLIAAGQAFWVRSSNANPFLRIGEGAKAGLGGAFYRLAKDQVDYMDVRVEGRAMHDRVFIRRRAGAGRGLDLFDAPKLANDKLTLAVLGSEGMRLAIHSLDTFACEEVIPLLMTFAGDSKAFSGEYVLDISSFGLFRHSRVTIRDNYLRQESNEPAYRFRIGSDVRSWDDRRFDLIVRSETDAPALSFALLPTNCRDTVVTVICDQSSPAFDVRARHGWPASFSGQSARINIPVDHFRRGVPTRVPLEARNLCALFLLDTVDVLVPEIPPAPALIYATICDDDRLRVGMTQNKKDSVVVLIGNSRAVPIVHEGDEFTFLTPAPARVIRSFLKSENGCHGDTIAMDVKQISAEVFGLIEEENQIRSSFGPALWYLNGKLLDQDSLSVISKSGHGLYEAHARIMGCDITAKTSFRHPDSNGVEVYPVPFDDALTIAADETILDIRFFSIDGRSFELNTIRRDRTWQLSTESLVRGVYLAEVVTATGVLRMKIVK